MNDPNKKIEIDKSSLLSLKAELVRKQEEVSRAKAFNSIDDFIPKRVPKPEQPPSSSARSKPSPSAKTNNDPIELEDSALLARSKQVLNAKTKYYNRMVASGGALNSDENCLVMFNQKKQSGKPPPEQDNYNSSSDSLSSDEEAHRNFSGQAKLSGDDRVEYTDFLGRSRSCLRRDLNDCLRMDKEMARSTSPREGQRRDDTDEQGKKLMGAEDDDKRVWDDEEDDIIGPVPSMAITEDTIGERFRQMREQWAHQEAENLDKDSVHYQDVLFDEARQHGVGYYEFSTDREERSRQQHELDTIREATVEAQKEKDDLRKARDRIITDRVKAAKARQRARLGLPPGEEEEGEKKQEKEAAKPGQSDVTGEELYDTTEERKRSKAEAKARKKREKDERKRERERQKHVRPWDEGKEKDDDMEWKPAKEWHVMSQEEWNEMKRKERISEFAPPVENPAPWVKPAWQNPLLAPQNDANHFEPYAEDDEEDEQIGPLPPDRFYPVVERMANNPLLTSYGGAQDEAEEVSMPTIPGMEDVFLSEEQNRTLFFTTKKKKEFKRRNYDAALDDAAGSEKKQKPQQTSVPIRNEMSDESGDEGECQRGRQGVEIPPPPTWDYYAPCSKKVGKKSRQPPVTKNVLEASIEAGLKFLREQSDKGGPSIGTKNRWSSNADY